MLTKYIFFFVIKSTSQSQNENGLWSASAFYDFEINAALWQKGWFQLLLALLFLGLIYSYFKNYIDRIEEKRILEKEMNELQRSALRAQMNPHFIFNSLNSIQKFIVQNDAENATIYLAKFAQLIRDILNASMTDEISIEQEIRLLDNYLTLEKLRFKNKFEYSIHVDESLDILFHKIPPLLTQPFVENAIIHGLTKITHQGKIDIQFIDAQNQIKIVIQDNGIGIYQAQKNRQAFPLKKGIGMYLSKKRLQFISKTSDIQITEIKNELGEIKGTKVELSIGTNNISV